MKQFLIKENYGMSLFENNIDLYEYIRKREKDRSWEHIREHRTGKAWSGNVTYEQAMNNLQYGNKDVTLRFIEGLRNLGHEVDVNTGIFMNTEGFAYDMGAVVSGEPECCVDMKAPEPKKSLTILMDYTAPCYVKGKTLELRGLAMANLLYTLVQKGYIINLMMCEVDILDYTGKLETGDNVRKHMMCIKVPTDTLSAGTIGFYTSLEFFRVIMILTETMCLDTDRPGDAKGSEYIEDYCLDKDTWLIPNCYMDKRGKNLNTIEEANEYVKTLFREYCEKHNLKEEI
jgi:hypothetical protein